MHPCLLTAFFGFPWRCNTRESDIEDNTHGHNTIGTYFGLFFASQILLLSRRARWFARSWWLHILAGWVHSSRPASI